MEQLETRVIAQNVGTVVENKVINNWKNKILAESEVRVSVPRHQVKRRSYGDGWRRCESFDRRRPTAYILLPPLGGGGSV